MLYGTTSRVLFIVLCIGLLVLFFVYICYCINYFSSLSFILCFVVGIIILFHYHHCFYIVFLLLHCILFKLR